MKEKYTPPLNNLKAIMIVHGKSEKIICDFIKSNLRIRIHVESDKNGAKSIEIGKSLGNYLSNTKFRTFDKFKNAFEDAIVDENSKKILPNDFKLFIVMDTDTCSNDQKQNYISGSMFKKYWFYKYIVPIYNSPNLEDVCVKAGIEFQKKGDKRKKEYIKIFPSNSTDKDTVQLNKFRNGLKKCNDTNMEELIDFCLKKSEENTIVLNK